MPETSRPRVTMDDVAAAAGVSRSLVSIAYRGVAGVSDETREHILAAGRALRYRPNTVASRLASRTGRSLGLFLLDLRNPVFADIFDGVSAVTEEAGAHLVLGVGDTAGTRDRLALETLLGARADVVLAAGAVLSDRELIALVGADRLVSVARRVPGVDSVYADDLAGARLVVDHLYFLGHRRIAHLAVPPTDGRTDRRAGYEVRMRELGLTPQVVTAVPTLEAALAVATPLLGGPGRPTAVFANNDLAALGVVEAAGRLGLRVPDDLSVVGYDDSPLSGLRAVGLTSVDQHALDLGRRSAEAALWRLENPAGEVVDVSLSPRLVVRSSATAPSS
ncbi:LacI family transcriptional regulator [Frondihabitans sp. PhB188]|uniref:LacI family DNA-binding transcriptional regulator n=1 Tax=Frondihabitans sp. PhB188 TaxID=2485200 RepID=UPI000FBB5F08|nr:LacI family DNA-binding transcriptional regulator [Frondihabitans sp. PhB188]ROQ38680.1 LacI family transcriptional regulator [Frondihabitans sp. PhB188]